MLRKWSYCAADQRLSILCENTASITFHVAVTKLLNTRPACLREGFYEDCEHD